MTRGFVVANETAMGTDNTKGKCDACGKSPRVLTKIDSGQCVCRTCLREIRPPRPKHLASLKKIACLRSLGFDVRDDLTQQECDRLLHHSELVSPYDTADGLPTERLRSPMQNIESQASTPGVRHFHTKIAGVSHCNANGVSRQSIIKRCHLWEQVILKHEEDNPYDPNAIAVGRENGEQLGYLNAELAVEVVENSIGRYRYAAFIKEITGGAEDHPTCGVNILIVEIGPGVPDEVVDQYIDKNRDALMAD